MRLSTKFWSSVNTKSTLMGLGIAMGVAAFALTGVGPMRSGLDDNVAAQVGSQQIPMRTLADAVQDLDRQAGNDPARRQANLQNALNQLIQEKVIIEEATRLGWTATDLEVADWIRKIPAFQNKDTKQFDRKTYQQFLKNGQFTELELFRNGRESIASRKYMTMLALPDATPGFLSQDLAKRNAVEFAVEYAEIAPSEAAVKTASAEAAKAFAADKANEGKLKALYDQNKDEFSRKAQTKVKSILVAFKGAERAQGEAANRTEADAQRIAQGLRDRAAKGEDFGKLAAATNDDPVAKSSAGDIGFVDDTNIDPDTAKAAAALSKANPLSDVVKTRFGFRVLSFADARPAVSKSFEQAKDELALQQVSLETREKMSADLDRALNDALKAKDAKKVSELLAQNGAAWKKVSKPVTVNTRFIDELGLADPLMSEIFTLRSPGDLTARVLDFSGRKAIFKLVTRADGKPPEASRLKLQERQENMRFAQTFVADTQRKLFDTYTRDKEIKRNASIFQMAQ